MMLANSWNAIVNVSVGDSLMSTVIASGSKSMVVLLAVICREHVMVSSRWFRSCVYDCLYIGFLDCVSSLSIDARTAANASIIVLGLR